LNFACHFVQCTFCCVGVHDILPSLTMSSCARDVPATRHEVSVQTEENAKSRYGSASRTAAHELPYYRQRSGREVWRMSSRDAAALRRGELPGIFDIQTSQIGKSS
jgi:hypothetical protein